MAEKNLIMYHDEDPKFITFLAGNSYEETIYAITKYIDRDGKVREDDIELAVCVKDIIKMRDFLNKIISKIEGD